MTPEQLASRILAAAGNPPLQLYTPVNRERIVDAARQIIAELEAAR